MRRTIPVLIAVALLLAMTGAPAGAIPKGYPEWDTWCDMDNDGVRETHTVQVASFQPGWTIWPVAVHAPAIWFGGHVEVWDDGELVAEDDIAIASVGMASRLTNCKQEVTFMTSSGVERRVLWDPLLLFFPRPAIPPPAP